MHFQELYGQPTIETHIKMIILKWNNFSLYIFNHSSDIVTWLIETSRGANS